MLVGKLRLPPNLRRLRTVAANIALAGHWFAVACQDDLVVVVFSPSALGPAAQAPAAGVAAITTGPTSGVEFPDDPGSTVACDRTPI